MTQKTPKPFNQKIRFWAARLLILASVPVILGTQSAWYGETVLGAVAEVVGILLIIAGVLYRFWAILYIGGRKNAQIVDTGPYSMSRHPLYFGTTLAVVGFGLMQVSLVLTLGLGLLCLGLLSATAKREEAFLRAEFGDAYNAYARRVPLIAPRPALFQTDAQITVRTDALRTNLADAMGFLALIPLGELTEVLHKAGVLGWFVLY